MTLRRDLKRRIRERQERTGERYTTARAHVLGKPRLPSWVVELHDVSEQARRVGIVCSVRVSTALYGMSERLPAVFERLHQILQESTADLDLLRAIVCYGETPRLPPTHELLTLAHVGSYFADLRMGMRGPGLRGRVLAFDVTLQRDIRTIVAQLLPRYQADPILVLSFFPDDASSALYDWIALWPHPRSSPATRP